MNIESRGGSLPQQCSSDMRSRCKSRHNASQSFRSQVGLISSHTPLLSNITVLTDRELKRLQANHVLQLENALADVQQQLSHETRRAQLLEQELTHLRSLTLQHTGYRQAAGVDGVTKSFVPGGVHPAGMELLVPSPGQKDDAKSAEAVPRPRPKSMDGYTRPMSRVTTAQVQRVQSAPADKLDAPTVPASSSRAVSSALHAVSGAYLREQAVNSTIARNKRRQIPSFTSLDSERMALRFVEEAQPVPLATQANTVTISQQAFELLVLKDRALSSIKEGITIADCSLPDHPLIYANAAFSSITGYSKEEVLGKNCRQTLSAPASCVFVIGCHGAACVLYSKPICPHHLQLCIPPLTADLHLVSWVCIWQEATMHILASSHLLMPTVALHCRFLQGPDTDPDEVTKMRDAVEQGLYSSASALHHA